MRDYSSTGYLVRAAFLTSEFLGTEFPALLGSLSEITALFKPINEYDDHEMNYFTGILARIIFIFSKLFKVLRSLFSNG